MSKGRPQVIRDAPRSEVDVTLIDRLLALTPAQRVKMLVQEVRNLAALDIKLGRR
jgi:hypothetical protein